MTEIVLNSKRSSIIKENSIMKRWGKPNDLIGQWYFYLWCLKIYYRYDLVVDGGLTKELNETKSNK